MSARHLRITFASAIVVFAASACSSVTGPDETSDLNTFNGTPLSDEHQGSDSFRGVDTPTQHDEHQGSDS